MILNKEQILAKLSSEKKHLEEKYGFEEIMLFGSFARNSASEESDIDIAVKLPGRYKTLSNYLGAKDELSKMLNRKVDLVYYNPEFLNPIIHMNIDKGKIIIE